jgi:predicted ATPase
LRPRIISVEIAKLFGNREIQIDLRKPEVIRVLFGQNGAGKTTILRILDAIFNLKIELLDLDFESVKIQFDNDQIVRVYKTPGVREARFVLYQEGLKKILGEGTLREKDRAGHIRLLESRARFFRAKAQMSEEMKLLRDETGTLSIGSSRSSKVTDLDFFTDGDDDFRLPMDLRSSRREIESSRREIDFDTNLFEFLHAIPVCLVPFNRTSRGEFPGDPDDQIEGLSMRFKALCRGAERAFSETIFERDSTFVERFLGEPPPDVSLHGFEQLSKELEALELRITRAGLISTVSRAQTGGLYGLSLGPQRALEPSDLRVIEFFLRDRLQSYEGLLPLVESIELFLKIINAKFSFTEITMNASKGIRAQSKSDLSQGDSILLSNLSSGEMNLLYIMFELCFPEKKGTLFLIDEPEISLNSTWQSHLLEEFAEFSEFNNCRYLVATHSPSIIGENVHLMHQISVRYSE